MTNETRQRIEAYKNALPEMKERVAAAAFLMVMSVMMMASATFAWITLSRAPEVTGMQTTVAANGNLEIALAEGPTVKKVEDRIEKADAIVPGESAIGDSSATEGQSIVEANKTWGNLVNVSDPSYGLSAIALRPALLSSYNRTEYPLNGATYGGDGRVVTTNDRYGFASYDKVEGTTDQYQFYASAEKGRYGVRAISSVGYSTAGNDATIDNFRNDTNQLYIEAQNYYGKIVSDSQNDVNTLDDAGKVTCISALEGLVGVFAQDKINEMGYGPSGASGDTSCSKYIWYMYQMMLRLQTALEKEGKALLKMANWQAYVASGDDATQNTFKSVEQLLSLSNEDLKNKGVTLTTLASYKKSVYDLDTCVNGLKDMAEDCKNPDAPLEEYYWDDISEYVNILVHVNTTSMNGVELQNVNGLSAALKVIGGGDVYVKKGALVDIEKRLVNYENRVAANVKVTVQTSIAGNPTVKGTVYTAAHELSTDCAIDLAYSDSLKNTARGDATAKDTYGFAMDMWVRTNYPGAVLTLEGSAKYENQPEIVTIEGIDYEVYMISIGEEELKREVEVYQKNNKWYYVSTLEEVNTEDMGDQTPSVKSKPVIVGYEGENRVWEDWRELLEGGYIEQDATTQGAGSCFVFYADTPTEQIKIMELLEAFNVAFMDQNGEILGIAKLNTETAYANQGKVTVPLEVETGVDYMDESGMAQKGITKLAQNTPTMITAIVYLNGSKLKNENVLADGELQGQLNIQFGTDGVLIAPDNEELQAQARSITATVTVGGETMFNGTIGGTEGLAYKEDGYKATVELTVDGEQPERIRGAFVRVVNSTQGMKGEEKNFIYNSETEKWEAEFILKSPGTYAFNTLLVDGVQYTLHDGTQQSGLNQYYPANRPYVHIKGLRLDYVSIGEAPGKYMTAEPNKMLSVTAKIEAAEEPRQVYAQFISKDKKKQYAALLKYDSTKELWTGSVNISSSGTFILDYVLVDGVPLEAPVIGEYEMYLGLKANVSTTVPEANRTYDYIGETNQFDMIVRIYDDSGNAIEKLPGVKLHYSNMSPAELTWNGTYYEGVLEATKPGQMRFKELDLGGTGTIKNVSNAPTFLARSMETPEYISGEATLEKFVAIGKNLVSTMTVRIKDGETATVWAEVEKDYKGVKTLEYLEGVLVSTEESTNISDIVFELPREDGLWTLKQLLLQDVYDKETGVFYSKVDGVPNADNSYVMIPKEENISTDVIVSYEVSVFYDGVEKGSYKSTENTSTIQTFEIDLTEGTPGAFLTEYTTKPITVQVMDYMERKIDTMTVGNRNQNEREFTQLQLTHQSSTTLNNGGYEIKVGTTNARIEFEDISANGKMMNFGTVNLKQAGEYTTSAFNISLGQAGTIDVLVRPKFVIKSVKPTVEIKDITLDGNGAYSIDLFETGSIADTVKSSGGCAGVGATNNYTTHASHLFKSKNAQYISRIENDRTVWLYFKCSHEDVATYSDKNFVNRKPHTYKYENGNGVPAVTMSISGMGHATNAKLVFTEENGGDVMMITEYQKDSGADTYWGNYATYGTDSFEWTKDGDCKRYIGIMDNGAGENGSDAKTVAGTIKSNTLILSDDINNEYSFSVDAFTIHNPF